MFGSHEVILLSNDSRLELPWEWKHLPSTHTTSSCPNLLRSHFQHNFWTEFWDGIVLAWFNIVRRVLVAFFETVACSWCWSPWFICLPLAKHRDVSSVGGFNFFKWSHQLSLAADSARGAAKSEAKVLGNRAREKVTWLVHQEGWHFYWRENCGVFGHGKQVTYLKHNHGVPQDVFPYFLISVRWVGNSEPHCILVKQRLWNGLHLNL